MLAMSTNNGSDFSVTRRAGRHAFWRAADGPHCSKAPGECGKCGRDGPHQCWRLPNGVEEVGRVPPDTCRQQRGRPQQRRRPNGPDPGSTPSASAIGSSSASSPKPLRSNCLGRRSSQADLLLFPPLICSPPRWMHQPSHVLTLVAASVFFCWRPFVVSSLLSQMGRFSS